MSAFGYALLIILGIGLVIVAGIVCFLLVSIRALGKIDDAIFDDIAKRGWK